MEKLTEMPNIGAVLAEKLQQVEIKSPGELLSIGSERAFMRIAAVDNTACMNMLFALEGAVQGIRWHYISKERKHELLQFLHSLNIKK